MTFTDKVFPIINCCSNSVLTCPFYIDIVFKLESSRSPLPFSLHPQVFVLYCRKSETAGERDGGWKEKDGGRERGKMSLQTELATLFFSRGNSLKLKLNLKLMKHILAVAFVSEVINYLYQPRRQRFLSVN